MATATAIHSGPAEPDDERFFTIQRADVNEPPRTHARQSLLSRS